MRVLHFWCTNHYRQVQVRLFIQAYEMFDSDPASWVALVAQLVEHLSGVQSVVGSNPTWGNSRFHFPLPQVSFFLFFFLSFFLSFYISYNIMYYIMYYIRMLESKPRCGMIQLRFQSRVTSTKLILNVSKFQFHSIITEIPFKLLPGSVVNSTKLPCIHIPFTRNVNDLTQIEFHIQGL